jgi:guanylate kinase
MTSGHGASRRGIPFVVSAPSGTGKTTVCRALIERDPRIEFSVSHTTRAPRDGERDGVDYHFVDEETFLAMVKHGRFLEHAEYSGSLYGTSHEALDAPIAAGRDVLLEIEVQGAAQVRERRADARFIFLVPPSMAELEERLRGRGTDAPEVIARRLAVSVNELAAVRGFDYVVVNDALEDAIAAVAEILAAERAGERRRALERHGREAALARGAGALAELPGAGAPTSD